MPTSTTATYNVSNQLLTSSIPPSGTITYDAAGDVSYDGNNSYLYDAEGRICATQNGSNPPVGYIYDGSGIRVAKGQLSRFTCDFNSADTTTYNGFAANTSWALGQSGEQLGEWKLTGSTWTWQHSNVYAGKLLGTYDTKGLHFYFDDWLGTRRIQTNATGQLELTCQSLPYGNGENCTPTALATAEDPTEQHFTGKERDVETGNDYFDARYYASAMGRFMSPDWAAKEEPVPYATFDDPQSLNLYSYVRNNPLSRADKDGHCAEDACILEGGAAAGTGLYLLGAAAIAGGAAVLNSPAGQRSFDTFTSAAGANLSSNFQAVKGAVTGWFSKSSTPAPTATLPDDANVVRGGSGQAGGANSPEGIAAGTATHPTAGVTGFSAESAPGKSVGQLAAESPTVSGRNQVGCCTVGQVRAAGGNVVPTSGQSPNHATVTGLTPAQASGLLTPTVPNPAKVKPQ
jgi:RHS repeat-associated protein